MSDFVNTIDVLGDDAVCDAIINRTLTEFSDDIIKSLKNRIFYENKNITNVNCPNVTDVGEYSFSSCEKLVNVNLPKTNKIGNFVFGNCYSLVRVNLSSLTTIEGSYPFSGCYSLKNLDIGKINNINSSSFFSGCSSLISLVLRSPTMCTLGGSYFSNCYHITGTKHQNYNPNGDKDGYFYVPSALIDTYKNATNWSAYADRFRAIEDYTVDGTVNGEIDWDKLNG